ncbi:MAG: putative Ig domain-containing protein [Nocardioidaceae bacterium]|nr:putative Ig domain-containing protein [Nocardioidaceae bacterium]
MPTHDAPVSERLRRRAALRLARGRQARGDDEGGFILLEVMIALTLITVIMAAVSMEYVNAVVVSSHQRSSVAASQLASTAMSELRAIDPSNLLTGRRLVDVTAQRNELAAIPKVARWISSDPAKLAYDGSATAAVVPTASVQQTPQAQPFRVYQYLECRDDATSIGTSNTCTSAGNAVRAVVAVTWPARGCPNGTCAFVTSSLIDTHPNPTFDLNQPLPPAPVIVAPGDQEVTVGDAVDLQLKVQTGKGVAPFSWTLTSGTLPTGLSLSPAGTVSGTVGGSTATYTSTVTVTDAFTRTAVATIRWNAFPRLLLAPVNSQAGIQGQAIAPVTLSASGGSGAPYAYTGTGLPPGLTVSTGGQVTGTPTKPGTYPVKITVTDSSGRRTASTTFSWTIAYPPIAVSDPGAQVTTVGKPDTVTVTASGGSDSYTFSATGLPGGTSIVNVGPKTGEIRGTPTATGTYTVTITVTDARSDVKPVTRKITYKVVEAPSATSPGNRATTRGGTVSVPVTSTCQNGPCRYTVAGQPNGVTIEESTGRLVGTVATNASTSNQVTVTATDDSGATGTATFTWTVNEKPAYGSPGNRTSRSGAGVSVDLHGFVTGGTAPFTYSASNLPKGLTIDPRTGVVGGTASTTSSVTSDVTVTAVDASGFGSTSPTFTWYVSDLVHNVPDLTAKAGTEIAINLSAYTAGGTTPRTYATLGNLPPGLSFDGTSLVGKPSATGTFPVGTRVTDQAGAFVTDDFVLTVEP